MSHGLAKDVRIFFFAKSFPPTFNRKKIFTRSETCPKCRTTCNSSQIKRIYIDFACDEELAIAQALKENKNQPNSDTDAEEMIKMLLEHIDNGMDEQQKQQHHQKQSPSTVDCDLCIAFQEAYERILTEKEQLEQVLNSIEREKTTKIIETSNVQVQASESNQQQCAKQNKGETVQKVDDDTVQSDLSILFSGR